MCDSVSFLTTFSLPLMNEEQIRKIRESRIKSRFPPTLVVLAIKAVAKNCTSYIDSADSQLQFLRMLMSNPREGGLIKNSDINFS
jgi:hypothetical protein